MIVGAILYIAGLILMAGAHGFVSVMIGGGVLIGASLACTAAAIAMSVAARAVPAAVRSTVLGIVSAAGSLGALLSAPIGQVLAQDLGWRGGDDRLCRAGARDGAGGVVRRQDRRRSAAKAVVRPAWQRLGREQPYRPHSAMRRSS